MSDKYLLIIEISAGYNTFEIHTSLEQAMASKKKSQKRNEDPICIYNLSKNKYVWFDENGPMYYETIAEAIIKKAKEVNSEG